MAFLCHSYGQPRIQLLPPTTFRVINGFLLFDLSLTNAGTAPFQFAEQAKEPEAFSLSGKLPQIRELFEITLSDRRGYVVAEKITEAPFRFRNQNRPTLAPKESVATVTGWGGAMELTNVTNGVFILGLRLNPTGSRWPPSYFDEAGTCVMVRITPTNAYRWTPPRPVAFVRPVPPQWVLDRYKTAKAKVRPPPLPSP